MLKEKHLYNKVLNVKRVLKQYPVSNQFCNILHTTFFRPSGFLMYIVFIFTRKNICLTNKQFYYRVSALKEDVSKLR